MRKLLAILASISVLAFAGCASDGTASAKSPWAAGARKPAVAKPANAAPTDVPEMAPAVAPAGMAPVVMSGKTVMTSEYAYEVPVATPMQQPLLSNYPELRRALDEKAKADQELAKKDSEPLPLPEEGKARVVAFDPVNTIIAFDTAQKFEKGNRVYLTKETRSTLVQVLAVEGSRVVAEEVAGLKNVPVLIPGDELICGIYVSPEDLAAIRAANLASKAPKQEEATEAVEEDSEEEYADDE